MEMKDTARVLGDVSKDIHLMKIAGKIETIVNTSVSNDSTLEAMMKGMTCESLVRIQDTFDQTNNE
eukprot:4468462-Prorocentrum_lima.AAC.1